MSIHDEVAFDKEGKAVPSTGLRGLVRRLFIPLCVVLVGLLSYGLGRLSGIGERAGVQIEYDPNIISALSVGSASSTQSKPAPAGQAAAASAGTASGEVYASSKGTKYYYSGCKSTISAANKVVFASAAMAEAAGYALASGCRQ